MPLDWHTQKSLTMRARNYLKAINKINGVSNGSRLLDFGCGRGHFLTLAKSEGYDAYGVEINPLHAEYARKSGAWILNKTLKEANFPAGYFNIITALHVLEHLENPFAEVLEMIRVLHKGGVLVVGVPNVDGLWHKVYGQNWIWVNAKEHIHQFPRRTLTFMMHKLGLEIIRVTTFPGHAAAIFPNKCKPIIEGYHQKQVTPAKGKISQALFYIQRGEIATLTYKAIRLLSREIGMHLVSPVLNHILATINLADDLMVITRTTF